MVSGRSWADFPWVRTVPTGASLLLASCVLLATGVGDRAASALGLGRVVCGAWALCAMAASAVNLGVPTGGVPVVLINPGGCLVPLGLALFLLTSGVHVRSLWRVAWVCGMTALLLAAGTAYGEQTGAAGATAALVGAAIAVVASSLGGDLRGALAGVAAGMALSCGLSAVAGLAGWAPWPPSLGGGSTFDAGMLGVIGTQVMARFAAAWRAQQMGSTAFRVSPH